jgi:hypothetical protein
VKRIVRIQSGFGCVICGSSITTYEHIDPEFHQAKEHNPDAITLLCANCHLRKTKGLLSVESVKDAMRTPKPKEQGYVNGLLDFGSIIPEIHIGNVRFIGGISVLRINEEMILGFLQPIEENTPLRLIARFFNSDGREIFKIIENEFFGNPESWDLESIGNLITVRNAPYDIALNIRFEPRKFIKIETAEMFIGSYGFRAKASGLQLLYNRQNALILSGGTVEGKIAFDVRGNNFLCKDNKFTRGDRFEMSPDASL